LPPEVVSPPQIRSPRRRRTWKKFFNLASSPVKIQYISLPVVVVSPLFPFRAEGSDGFYASVPLVKRSVLFLEILKVSSHVGTLTLNPRRGLLLDPTQRAPSPSRLFPLLAFALSLTRFVELRKAQ